MKRWQYIESVAPTLTMFRQVNGKYSDVLRLPIYHEYCRRKAGGEKVEAIVYDIQVRTGISRGELFKFIRRMGETI